MPNNTASVATSTIATADVEDFDGWMQNGLEQYGEFSVDSSLTAEVVVGSGENYDNIQEAFDAGFSCIYLKTQRFNITQPIKPPKEDFYLIGDGAEIVATEPMSEIFDISNIRYAHFDGLFINGNGLAQKCINAMCTPSRVPMHQIRNCKIWGATLANVDLTGCEDSLIFNCWIDGRKVNDTPDTITEYGVKIGEFSDGYVTGGQINLIHCLISFHRKADIFAKNIAQLKLANCLLASKNMWSTDFEAHIIVEGGTGNEALLPILELTSCWIENGPDGDVPNILIKNHMIWKLTIIGGKFQTNRSPNIYSALNPCAETITLISALFTNDPQYNGYNMVAPVTNLVSVGNSFSSRGIDKANVANFLVFDEGSIKIDTNTNID